MDKVALLKKLGDLETMRASLHSSFRFWEWMVVVGLGFDLIVIIKEYLDDRKDYRRREIHPPHKPSAILLLLALLGTGLIALGISEELSVDSKISKVETDTRQANSELFGIVSKEAEDAGNALLAVQQKSSVLDQRLTAEITMLDMVDQKVLTQGPRWELLENHKAEFIKAMKPFAPQRIILVNCGLSGGEREEADKLQEDLRAYLSKFDEGKNDGAGWTVEERDEPLRWSGCEYATIQVPPIGGGIALVVSDTADFESKRSAVEAVNKLDDTLNRFGIFTRQVSDTHVGSALPIAEAGSFWKAVEDDPKAMFLLVGPNPKVFGRIKENPYITSHR